MKILNNSKGKADGTVLFTADEVYVLSIILNDLVDMDEDCGPISISLKEKINALSHLMDGTHES